MNTHGNHGDIVTKWGDFLVYRFHVGATLNNAKTKGKDKWLREMSYILDRFDQILFLANKASLPMDNEILAELKDKGVARKDYGAMTMHYRIEDLDEKTKVHRERLQKTAAKGKLVI